MPPKRPGKRRRNAKAPVLIFNLIRGSLLFLARVREAQVISPGRIWDASEPASSVRRVPSRQGEAGAGLPCLIKPPFRPSHSPKAPVLWHETPSPDQAPWTHYPLFICARLLVRANKCEGHCLAEGMTPRSTHSSMSAILETGVICGPRNHLSRWVQGEGRSNLPLPSLPSCQVQSNSLSLSKCLMAPTM